MREPGDGAVERIQFLLERNRVDAAKSLVGEALAKAPNEPTLQYFSACIDYAEDRNGDALATLDKLLGETPHYPAARELRFDVLEEQGRHAEAEQAILELLRDYPEESDYYAKYAMLMLQTHHLDKAARLAEEAMRLDPQNILALLVSTLCALIMEPSPVVQERLAELLRSHPEAEASARTLILVLHQNGKEGDALRIAQELLRANPGSQELVELVVELQLASHWSMWPLLPFVRHGWLASAVMWMLAVGSLMLLARSPVASLAPVAAILWLVFVVYSWTWPAVLRRHLKS